ncbi:MAG: response regulator [bacterium]
MSDSQPLILVIEDEVPMLRFLRVLLTSHRYAIVEAMTGAEGIREAATRQPDLVLLDLGLPDLDGLEVTRNLRAWSAVPIIVLSARGREQDKIEALDLGADDYLTKPFGAGELLARIRAALRKKVQPAGQSEPPVFQAGGLRVDLALRRVWLDEEDVHLTPIEYKLLTCLVRNAGRVLTHRQILKEVWGNAYEGQEHYVRVHMAQLRKKIERDPAQPEYILTELGVGYRLRSGTE